MSKILPLVAALTAALCTSTITYAGENKTPDIDGSNNGSSLKYNQNCLDIAYKNAYGTASGKPTSSSDYKNYKCYINGKVVPCTSMTEDGQTKKAEADYQTYLDSIATSITGEQLISYTDIIAGASTTPHYGYAQYTNYGGVQQFYGTQGRNGVTAFQCWEGKNPGCEVGVDARIFKKFADAGPDDIYVSVNGVDYPLSTRKVSGTPSKYYWSGNLGNDNVTDFTYHDNTPTRIMFVDPALLSVLKENNGKSLKFEIKIKSK